MYTKSKGVAKPLSKIAILQSPIEYLPASSKGEYPS